MNLSSLLRRLSLLLLLAIACADAGGDLPRDGGRQVDRPAFEGSRAFSLLEQQVAFGPRIPGTEGHRRQLEWMTQFLRERADTVVQQSFTHTTAAGERLELSNVFARFRPEMRERVLLLAHWDTRPMADQDPDPANRQRPVPGANDGASGVAVLLELAEMFRRQPPPVGVDILLTDGEDYGPGTEDMFLGARYFAANLPAGYAPLYGILLDMVADQDPRFPVEGNSAQLAPEVARRVWAVAAELDYSDIFPNTVGDYVTDDHIPLNQAGIRTVNIIDFQYGPGNRYWHTLQDVPENTSAETLRIVGEVVAELVYRGG
ncbi:MAG TPA: M28 family peptidase [Longimicrobiaceae bacterium]|nr:M28 family peptidase [Longimicrobiaceae bacterium]